MRHFAFLAVLAVLGGALTPLSAEDVALLMGADYKNAPDPALAGNSLPGVALDMDNMKAVAKALGFQKTIVLWNETATYANMKSAFQSLAQVGQNDRVLIYFSGHGAQVTDQNGDEADGLDEALIPFDLHVANGAASNILIDDEIGELLDKIPSSHILVIFDSCHSGTATRAFGAPNSRDVAIKFLDLGFPPAPHQNVAAVNDFLPKGVSRARFVSIMASKDSETSLATSQGSLLTNAVAHAFVRDRGSRCSVELQALFQKIQTEVVTVVEGFRRKDPKTKPQTPQLEAEDPALLKQSMEFRGTPGCASGASPGPGPGPVTPPPPPPAPGGPGPLTGRMQYWSDFVTHAGQSFPFQTNGASMAQHPNPNSPSRCSSQQGLLKVSVIAPRDGYLNILDIGEGDPEATVIFPNQYQPQNQVRRGERVEIPAQGQTSWCLPARLPAGRNSQNVLVFAVFTDGPVNLYTQGKGTGPFREAPDGTRSFAPESGAAAQPGAQNSYAASQTVVAIHR